MALALPPEAYFCAFALSIVVLACWWTFFLLRIPQKMERDAFQTMQGVCDNAADLNKRMGQIITQLGNLASQKPFVEIPQIAQINNEPVQPPHVPLNGSSRVRFPSAVTEDDGIERSAEM